MTAAKDVNDERTQAEGDSWQRISARATPLEPPGAVECGAEDGAGASALARWALDAVLRDRHGPPLESASRPPPKEPRAAAPRGARRGRFESRCPEPYPRGQRSPKGACA